MLEYLFNNDTQQMRNEVCCLAQNDEPTLHRKCQEVSHRVDTSSLDAKGECIAKANGVNATFAKIAKTLQELSRSLESGTDIFATREGKRDFGAVCRAVTAIEDARRELLSRIAKLTQARQKLFLTVADANRALHFLKTAKQTVPEERRAPYARAVEIAETAYALLKKVDAALCELQKFCMTFIERHLPAFMERLRTAADFNHAGASLGGGAIRTLCSEALIVINRAPNIAF